MAEKSYFQILNGIDASDKIEKKNGLSYLPWAAAWEIARTKFPGITSKVYEREDGRIYWDDGRTAWVKVSTTLDEIEDIEYYPIMDFKNKSIPVENITSMDVNKAIQRGIVKSLARKGLGLYIYNGDELPDAVNELDEINEENYRLASTIAKENAENKEKVGALMREYTKNNRNPNPKNIKDIDVARELNAKLKQL